MRCWPILSAAQLVVRMRGTWRQGHALLQVWAVIQRHGVIPVKSAAFPHRVTTQGTLQKHECLSRMGQLMETRYTGHPHDAGLDILSG